jgi:flagellum-specific peptidoglycan hydrolase FlgJ
VANLWLLLGGAATGAFLWHESAAKKPRSAYVPLSGKAPFIQAVADAIGPIQGQLSDDSWALVIAHAAFESGWGKAKASTGWNWFNITAGAYWAGPVQPGPDTEYDAAGNVKKITQRWRVYADGTSAIQDYLAFLKAGYVGAYQRLLTADGPGFAAALGVAGYYTLPMDLYVQRYTNVLNSVWAESARMNAAAAA